MTDRFSGTVLPHRTPEPSASPRPPTFPSSRPRLRTKTGRAWGELPGHLRTEILQMSQGRYLDEYARLIELYFREIAADATTRGAKP